MGLPNWGILIEFQMNQDTAVILLIQLHTWAYYPLKKGFHILILLISFANCSIIIQFFPAQEKKDRRLYVVDISVLNEASLQVSSERVSQLYILKHVEFAYFYRSF